MEKGKVFLVGAGPGDPKLITLRGLECIQQADVIAYDRLVNPSLLDHAKEEAELIYCGKLPDRHTLRQEKINELLIEKALEGKHVVRLKGGDPCVFGRVGEEAEELAQHGIEYEIVPGITSGIAVPAYAGIPVTHRDYSSSVAMVTGHGRAEKGKDTIHWKGLAEAMDTLVFYMGIANLEYICQKLMEHGREVHTPVAVIEWGTTEKQRSVIGTLETIQQKVLEQGISHPAIIVVGEVVRLREKINWFEEKINGML